VHVSLSHRSKSIYIVDGSICRSFQGGMSRTSIYVHTCIVCFNVFLKVGVYCISYMCFWKINVIRLGSYYCKRNTKEKSVICEISVISILLRSRYVSYWDGELIISPIQMWLTPQPYRCYSFGCRYTWGGWRSSSSVFEILRLKPNATVVMCRTMGVHYFVHFVYGLWPTCHLFFCVAILLLYDLNVVKP